MTRAELEAIYAKSRELSHRLLSVTPGGAQTLSKRQAAFGTLAFPAVLTHGSGPYVFDVDQNRYVDLILGLAAVGVGHCHAHIDGRVHVQVGQGASFSLPSSIELEVAERLVDNIPCADMVRFVKTGSEACQAAVRIARRATGRDVVLVCGYHGWHDWYAASRPVALGVPGPMRKLVAPFRYNSLEDLSVTAQSVGGPDLVAAVIMEPTLFEAPEPEYLEGVRQFCSRHGIALIFDEMVTGYRWDHRGYQHEVGVTPDLATFGKAMANGYPLACVVGKRGLMEKGDVISGTFGGEAIGLAAADATLDLYEEEGVCDDMAEAGVRMLSAFKAAIADHSLPARMVGHYLHPRIDFDTGDPGRDGLALALLVQSMALNGVLIHPGGWNVASAHAHDEVLDEVTVAIHESAKSVANSLRNDTLHLDVVGQAPASGVRQK